MVVEHGVRTRDSARGTRIPDFQREEEVDPSEANKERHACTYTSDALVGEGDGIVVAELGSFPRGLEGARVRPHATRKVTR